MCLKFEPDFWPAFGITLKRDEVDRGMKKTVITSLISLDEEFSYFSRVSHIKKTIRITAWMIRFIDNCKTLRKEREFGNLKNEESKRAEVTACKIVEKDCFKSEKDERLHHLQPFVDLNGVIGLKSRICMREDLEDFKLPLILPSDHPVVTKLITEKHY